MVSEQLKDENSLLNHFKKVIALRKQYPALAEDGEFDVISNGYPAIYKRSLGDEVLYVATNPSDRKYEIDADGEILMQQNAKIKDAKAKISGCGYVIYKK